MISIQIILFMIMGNFLYAQRKQIHILDEKLTSLTQITDQIGRDHPVLVNADLFFSKQLREINKQLVSMDNQIQNLENIRENDGGYQHALRILEMGGDKEEIINSCHLSNAEAELLMNLQAYRSAIKA